MTKRVCIIPARMGSSRFPGKPLTKIKGREMLCYVHENCKKAGIFDEVVIATPDREIENFCISNGYQSIMTSEQHERASDRCNEAIKKLETEGKYYNIVTLVQGDEPLVDSEVIKKITVEYEKERKLYSCANGIAPLGANDYTNPNSIKVITNIKGEAIYMSRVGIPYNGEESKDVGKQICIIPFTPESLKKYSELEPTPLEKAESVDMLRFIENGLKVKMIKVKTNSHPVDVPNDVLIVEQIMDFNED